MLSSEQIAEFQLLYERRFGKKVGEQEAYEMGTKLVTLMKMTCQSPPKKENKERNERRRQNGNNHD